MSDSLPKHKKLIPISDAAKILGVSIDTVRRWDKSGILISERPDGKNRYFFLDNLERHRINQPLSISEAARELGISAVTLRRLEIRGLLNPKRNSAGERVYDKESLKNFLKSDYFLRKKHIEEKIPGNPAKNAENISSGISAEFSEKLQLEPNLKPLQRMPELMASTLVFLLLLTLGIRNVIPSTISYQPLPAPPPKTEPTPAVLAETEEATSAATPEIKTETILAVKLEDGATNVNIRQKPTVNSEKIGKAKAGDTFEFVSFNSGWYEVKLPDGSTGFISEKYVEMNEVND